MFSCIMMYTIPSTILIYRYLCVRNIFLMARGANVHTCTYRTSILYILRTCTWHRESRELRLRARLSICIVREYPTSWREKYRSKILFRRCPHLGAVFRVPMVRTMSIFSHVTTKVRWYDWPNLVSVFTFYLSVSMPSLCFYRCAVREVSLCPHDGVRKQMTYSI